MAGLDTSIYFKQQAPDLMGSFEKGLNMRSMLDERNQKAALKDAYNQGMVTNPDGTTSFDSSKIVGALNKAGLGQQAFEAQQNFDKQNKAKQLEQLNMTGQILGSANDQNSWALAKARASQMGIDVSQIPDQYDPKLKSFLQGQTLSAAQQLQNDLERQRIAESSANRADARAERMFNAGMTRQNKLQDKEDARLEKLKNVTNEVEDRRRNINSSLDQLDAMIEKNGTFELLGSHNQTMERLVDEVATDMAKLQDPSSVARPSEVEAVKKNLVQAGFYNSNATAREILKNFKADVKRRADSAYQVRGVEIPSENRWQDPDVLEYAKKYNISPDEALKIKNDRMGGQ